jgi:adenylate cyclase
VSEGGTEQDGITERVAAILAADAVGYSRLMADDEKATIASLDRSRAVFTEHIEANQGRVVDTAGDSVLAVFGTTNGAVRASVAIQEGLAALNEGVPDPRRMQFRIGIHLGDIHEKASDGTIYGDGVNVAARLEALSEPGGIIVSDAVHSSLRDRLDVGFEFLGEHKGKNLRTPVKAYRLLPEGVSQASVKSAGSRKHLGVIAAALVGVVVLAGVVWWQMGIEERPTMLAADGTPTDDPLFAMPSVPVIAVLPFVNLSNDPEQGFFADGVTEDIVTRLSRFDAIRVIAGMSTARYSGGELNVRDVGQELSARYILRGSIRRSTEEVRITAKLIDAKDGSSIWAEDFDRPVETAGLFATQAEITGAVVAGVASTGGVVFGDQLANVGDEYLPSTASYDCVLLAHRYSRVLSRELHLAARNCLEAVVEREPDYAEAWAFLAAIYHDQRLGMNPEGDVPDPVARMKEAAQRAISINPKSSRGHKWLAITHYWTGDAESFLEAARQAISLNPYDASIYADIGLWLWNAGQTKMGAELMSKAIALTPNPPRWYYRTLMLDQYRKRNYEEALKFALKAEDPGSFWSCSLLAMTYGQLGKRDEAATAIEELLEIIPDYRTTVELFNEPFAFGIPEERQHWIEGLEKAGLFDHPELALPTGPSIAVLPFRNISDDSEQDYFVEGLSADIARHLSLQPEFFVIGRATTSQYKGDELDVQTIGAELNVEYLLAGDVRRSGDKIRVSAELLDAVTGRQLWANAYDRELSSEGVFAVQDEITLNVATTIGDQYGVIAQTVRELASRQDRPDLTAYECVLLGYRYFETIRPDDHKRALDCLEAAVEDAPNYADAWGWLAILYSHEGALGYNARARPHERALDAALNAIKVGPNSQMAWEGLAAARFFRHEFEAFDAASRRTIELNSQDASSIANIANYYGWWGEFEVGLPLMEKAMALSPYHPYWYYLPFYWSAIRDGDYEEALRIARRSHAPGLWYSHQRLASALALNGELDEARSEAERMDEAYPGAAGIYWEAYAAWNVPSDIMNAMAKGLRDIGVDLPPKPATLH